MFPGIQIGRNDLPLFKKNCQLSAQEKKVLPLKYQNTSKFPPKRKL